MLRWHMRVLADAAPCKQSTSTYADIVIITLDTPDDGQRQFHLLGQRERGRQHSGTYTECKCPVSMQVHMLYTAAALQLSTMPS